MKEHKTHKNEEEVVTDKVKNNRIISSSLCFTGLELTTRNCISLSFVKLQQFYEIKVLYLSHSLKKILALYVYPYPFLSPSTIKFN